MSEQHRSRSEGFWCGLCVLLLLLLAGTGVFGVLQYQRATKVQRGAALAVNSTLRRVATLEERVHELEAENRELREPLKPGD